MKMGEHVILTRGLSARQREEIQRDLNDGFLLQLARGVYVPKYFFREQNSWDQYVLRACALGLEGRVLAGRAAAVMHGMPTKTWMSNDVDIVGEGRKRPGINKRRLPKEYLYSLTVRGQEIYFTSPADTIVDIARWYGIEDAVRCGDWAVRVRLTTFSKLRYSLKRRAGYTGAEVARTAVRLINGHSESPRESDVKSRLFEAGYPSPIQQPIILDAFRRRIGRVDFLFPQTSIVLEYDGRGKTRGNYGQPPKRSIQGEHSRQRLLRAEHLDVIRIDANANWAKNLWLKELEESWAVGVPLASNKWLGGWMAWG